MKIRVILSVLAAASLAACSHIPRDVPATAAQTSGVLERFGRDQAALDALAAARPNLKANFDWARAQCFVQHAYSEQHENDASGFAAAALGQAEAITQAVQGNTAAPATALINHPQKMRNDLWNVANQYKGNRCAQATAGCLEVQLVRAGHEHRITGWRHATSYFAIAEDMAQQAKDEAGACAPQAPAAPAKPGLPAAPPSPPTPPPPQPPKPAVQQQTINLRADVLFKFGKAAQGDVLTQGRRQLDDAAARLKAVNLVGVKVIGYTDPQGSDGYNQRLSERRADAVKALLVQRGVDAAKITTEGRGERDVIAQCDAKKLKGAALNTCNQPNRRVLIEFSYQPR